MRIPKLNTPLTIQKPRAAVSGDSFNQPDYQNADNWIDLFGRRAEVRPAGGRELQSAAQTVGEISHLVTVRYDEETKTVKPSYRLRIGVGVTARYMDVIRKIDLEERHRWLELQCLERVA